MYSTICGIFGSNKGGVAGYVDRIGTKYAAKWGGQMAGMNFQTRSRKPEKRGGVSVLTDMRRLRSAPEDPLSVIT